MTSPSASRRLWIREVVDRSHPRIAELWWALYEAGRRSDVWYFTATPGRTGNKILPNYRLESVSMPAKDTAIFRVRGEMFRPGGAWSIAGNELIFTVGEGSLVLDRVRNVFSLLSGYDTGEGPLSISVSTEREIGGRYEIRGVGAVPPDALDACRCRPLLVDYNPGLSWDELLKLAESLTGRPEATVRFRELGAPSFCERDR